MFARLFCARAFAGLVSVTMMAFVLAIIPSSARADDPPPPVPPVQYDPSCSDLDEYWFEQFSPYYDYYANGKWMDAGKKYSTKGASVVSIEAVDPWHGEAVVETWEFVFETTECDFTEAPNGYLVKVGKCHPRTGHTDLVVLVRNKNDATNRYLPSAAVNTTRSDGWGPSYAYDIAERILDGETRAIVIGALYGGGVPPGTYTHKIYLNGRYGKVVAVRKSFVPKCGTSVPPQGDPGLNTPSSHTRKKPTGILSQVKGSTMRAKAINRGVPTTTQYKVVATALSGRVTRWWFKVRPRKVAIRFYHVKPNTRFVMYAKYKHGGTMKWRVVARNKIRSVTS